MSAPSAQVQPSPRSRRGVSLLPRIYLNFVGHKLIRFLETIHGLGAFTLITFAVAVRKFNQASAVVHPLVRTQIANSGVRLLPMISFIGLALGFVIIGQIVLLQSRVGAQEFAGVVMVSVIVREIGPFITAMLVLGRVGTATVIELGTARAQGEVEALEALGIDPIHYLVVPRVIGIAFAVFSLTVYLILIGLAGGYLFAFIQDVPLLPGDYVNQLAAALRWQDFLLLGLKTGAFGIVIAMACCFQGLARPLRLDDVPEAATRAVGHSVVACVLIDALFIVVYLLL
ncbi:MAG: ABC transporter permease [Opitutaceae bacterium]|nr:ABC transporter permease [Verrucomicrobiales bacterium]